MTISRRGPGPAPLSFPQERMFLLDRIMPGIPAYNVPRLARVTARLDPGALQAAFDGIVARHEILRTRIVLAAGEPVQEVMPARPVELTTVDVSALPASEREGAALAAVADVAWRPFDISGDILLRGALVGVGENDDLLLLVNHHLGSDHVSGALLFAELNARYEALATGSEPELPELEIQYADYAAWQRSHLTGDLLDDLLAHWREVLDGAPERLELPTDRPRPPAQTYRGGQLELTLSPELVEPLQALARSERVSLFVVLLTTFTTLMHRYSRQTDLVVGTPVSGRNHEETRSLVGYFSNTLPIRSDLRGDPSFRDLLGRVGGVTRTALAFQELPFERLVQAINPDRAASHTPIFQVLFGFDIDPSANPTFAGAPLTRLPIPGNEYSRFDLSLVVRQRTDGRVTGTLEYSCDLFDRATAERMLGHFEQLLVAVRDDPDRRLSELPLLSAAERSRLVSEWNATRAEYPAMALHELFAEQAARRPDAVAVRFESERMTYGELERGANQLAHELRALGAEPGTLVGICMGRSLDLVVALFGVLKSGAAYVPIDPSYPQQRVAFMLASADAPVLIAEDRVLSALPPHNATVLCLDRDRDRDRIARHGTRPPAIASGPDALAYVIYTSGSTGKPKGVEIAHRSVVNLITHMRERPGLDETDVVANLTTHAFDLSVPDWYLPLCHGGELVIVPSEEALDGVALADRLRRSGATFVQATPTTWQLLLDASWHGSDRLKIVCGGEALPRGLANELVSRGTALWHMYGPTETTVWSSILELSPGEGPPPLGGPIANTRFYVLDEAGQVVPIGVPGELHIGGDGVARGYRGRADLTAERFIPDPFSPTAGDRLYKTGDLVRWREKGTLEFLGRIDQQVKLRGFRIELAEIETVLAAHPQVAAAAAAVREDAPGDRRLVAYFVPDVEGPPVIDELRRLARCQLPPYMIPSAFVELDALPTTANRKLDRAALPAPGGERTVLRPYAEPTRPVEEKLVEVWRDVLGVDQVGIDDDFFELGGHSLLAVRMLARVIETLDVELPLTAIFDHPTIREQCDLISEQLLGDASEEDLAALIAEIETGSQQRYTATQEGRGGRLAAEDTVAGTPGFRVTPQQQRILALDPRTPVSQCAAVVHGPIDATALHAAVQRLVGRHEVLRTRILRPPGIRVPQQVISDALAPGWRTESGTAEATVTDDAALDELLGRDAGGACDLRGGPALYVALHELSRDTHMLVLTMPSAVADGVSILILLDELGQLYSASGGRDLPVDPVQYADYAEWRHELVTDDAADEKALAFWRAAATEPPDRPALLFATPTATADACERVAMPLAADLAAAVDAAAQASRVEASVFLEACWHALIARLSGATELLLAGRVDGRVQADLEHAVGAYAQLVPIPSRHEPGTSLAEVVDQVRRARVDGVRWQDYASAEDLARLADTAPIGFAYLETLGSWPCGEAGLELRGVREGALGAWLQCSFTVIAGVLGGELRYDPAAIGRDEAAEVATRFAVLLTSAAENPQQPVAALPILDATERARLVSVGAPGIPPTTPVHHLFEDWAAREPERQAVTSAVGKLTYAELDRAANRLAHRLREAGVGPDAAVGLGLERGPDMIIGLLAIMKAGGAYVPLNVEHPPERLGHQLAEAGAVALITHEGLLDRMSRFEGQIICTDRDAAVLSARPALRPERIGTPEDLAYIIYTSGSTGLPKGVGVTHANLANYTAAMVERLGFDDPDVSVAPRAAVVSSISTDLGNTSIFPVLAVGGCLQLLRPAASLDPDAFAAELGRYRPDLLKITPSHLRAFLAARGADVLPSRWLVLGGEALPWELVDEIHAHQPACRIMNHYGPTETTIGCLTFAVPSRPSTRESATVPIGDPIANTRAYVVDSRLEPVPPGVPGELVIGGSGVARGYVNNEVETAERFGPDPFAADPSARTYRTGDRVRRLRDGTIEFLGRVDQQLKIRGYRVEPGEIEATLARHHSVRHAAVVAPEDERGESRLVAYVVASPMPPAADLRDFLAHSLPDYMVPAMFVAVDAMPLTPSGKVDRQALVELTADTSGGEEAYVAPRDPLEREIADIWCELLGVDRVGVYDDFFALGGHSLLATQAIMRIRRRHGDLPLHALLGAPTVAALADVVRGSKLELAS